MFLLARKSCVLRQNDDYGGDGGGVKRLAQFIVDTLLCKLTLNTFYFNFINLIPPCHTHFEHTYFYFKRTLGPWPSPKSKEYYNVQPMRTECASGDQLKPVTK